MFRRRSREANPLELFRIGSSLRKADQRQPHFSRSGTAGRSAGASSPMRRGCKTELTFSGRRRRCHAPPRPAANRASVRRASRDLDDQDGLPARHDGAGAGGPGRGRTLYFSEVRAARFGEDGGSQAAIALRPIARRAENGFARANLLMLQRAGSVGGGAGRAVRDEHARREPARLRGLPAHAIRGGRGRATGRCTERRGALREAHRRPLPWHVETDR